MKLIAVTTAFCIIALTAYLGMPGPKVVRAQSGCAVDTLSAPYGYSLTGSYYDQQGYSYGYASAGTLVPDGQGNLTGVDTVSYDGYVTQQRGLTGKYTVNADCSGSAQLTYSDQTGLNVDFVIVDGARSLTLIDADQGLVVHGSATAIGGVPATTGATDTTAARRRAAR